MKLAYIRVIRPHKKAIYKEAIRPNHSLNKFDLQGKEAEKGSGEAGEGRNKLGRPNFWAIYLSHM